MAVSSAIRSFNEEFLPLDKRADDCLSGPIRTRPFINVYRSEYEFVHPFKLKQIHNHIDFYQNGNVRALFVGNVDNTCVYCNLYLFGFQRFSKIIKN